MARMYPTVFPRAFNDADPEFVVYQCLRTLPDTYSVFYSRRLEGGSLFGVHECEIDFIIWNHHDVLICLEVKGGVLAYDGKEDRWSQNGTAMKQGPDRQATSATHALLKHLATELRDINTGWALCFPQCTMLSAAAPSGVPTDRLIDEGQLRDLPKRIARLERSFRDAYRKPGVAARASDAIVTRLTRGIGFVSVLGVRIVREARDLVQVTDQQLEVLDDLELNQRVVVHGAAGTGKTILAQEFAKRASAQGRSVLLLFYNKAIAKTVRHGFERTAGVEVSTFSSFARLLVEAHFPDWWSTQDRGNPSFWGLVLPAKLLDIPEADRPKYDALIVDEGQDFKPEWFEFIGTLLRTPVSSHYCVFLDEHQDIFRHWSHFPCTPAPYRKVLSRNCRNTKAIVDYLNRSHPVKMGVFERSPTGVPVVERVVRDAADEQLQLGRDIKQLITKEHVSPGSIVILLNSPKTESSLDSIRSFDGIPLKSTYERYDPSARCVYYSTIDIFKGLEADVVFVLLGEALSKADVGKAIYVQGSRAKHALYVYSRR